MKNYLSKLFYIFLFPLIVLCYRALFVHSDKDISSLTSTSQKTPLPFSSELHLDEKTPAPSPSISINIFSPSHEISTASSQTQSTISINIDSPSLTKENSNIAINIEKNSPKANPSSQEEPLPTYPITTNAPPSPKNILSIPEKACASPKEIINPPFLITDTPSEPSPPKLAIPMHEHTEDISILPSSPKELSPEITISSEETSSNLLFSIQENPEQKNPLFNSNEKKSSLESPSIPTTTTPSETTSSAPLFSVKENEEQEKPVLNNNEKKESLEPQVSLDPPAPVPNSSELTAPETIAKQPEQSILPTPPSTPVSLITSTEPSSKQPTPLINQQPTSSPLEISLELKAGRFFFIDSLMRSIYTTGGLSLQLCGSFPVGEWLDIYTSIGYQQRSGHSLNMKEATNIWQIPIDLGLKPIIKITPYMQYYLAIGPRYFHLQQNNDSVINNQKVSYDNVGFFINTGFNFLRYKHLLVDVFGEYSFEKVNFKSTDLTIHSRTAQVGGFVIGLGIGYSF